MEGSSKYDTVAAIYHGVLAASAIIYGSGFIVVYTFLERWGIRETGDQLLRVKYFHVGFLCVLFPLLWLIPMYAIGHILRARRKTLKFNWKEWSAWLTPPFSLALSTTLCFIPVFAHGDYVRHHGWETALLVVFTLVGLILATDPIKQLVPSPLLLPPPDPPPPPKVITLRMIFAFLLLVAVGCLFYKLSVDLGPELRETFITSITAPAAWLYICFNLLIAFYYDRGSQREEQLSSQASTAQKESELRSIRAVTLCRIVGFYFLGVISFSYGWYPFIPAARGGGSLLEVPTATINVKVASTKSADLANLFDASQTEDQPEFPAGVSVHARTGPVALIEVTSDSLFISRIDDDGGPSCWAEGHLPRVFELPRSTIESVEYEMPASSKLENDLPVGTGLLRRIRLTIVGAPHPFKYLCSPDIPKPPPKQKEDAASPYTIPCGLLKQRISQS
jgi:hypothetical protein